MTIQQLIYAVEVAKHGSLNKTAKILYLSQPTLSKALMELEDEVGITIFQRSNKGMELTPEGEVFIKYANSMVEQYQKMKNMEFKKRESEDTFELSSVSSSFVAEAFAKLCEHYKYKDKINLYVYFNDISEVIDDVYEEKSDMGIIFTSSPSKKVWLDILKARNIEYVTLKKSLLSILISKNDPLSKKSTINVNDLEDYAFIYYQDDNEKNLTFLNEHSLLTKNNHKKTICSTDRALSYKIISRTKAFTFVYNQHENCSKIHNLTCVPFNSGTNSNAVAELGYIKIAEKELSEYSQKFLAILKNELNNHSTKF